MDDKPQNQQNFIAFSDSQFNELQRLLQNYLKMMALSNLKEQETDWNIWLLDSVSYSQEEIAKILDLSQPTVSRVLAGKATKRRAEK